ncbi:hypothetical protein BHM13_000056 [Escherichia coli]|uniref:hypothetical protein n=1 Tax=Escherichia coli TaxID=562 RepID=UPI000BE9A1AC|nr:hypothetical protein [Escherichia coli]EEQ2110829.1 hypothetical protein [Escherichia coli O157:H7]EHY1365501.1 hypothetical protein [Escherichia coli O157]ELP2911487.1 hypothetical protein [Escherichia coli O128]EMC9026550.1 hypothetical protein [Shigella sonnei]EEC9068844.1 hypothetical protein [Escherichia coli]
MSKVRVIFEFEHVSHDEKPAGNDSVEVHEKIGVDVKTERDTNNRPTSLCDVYASILQYHSPEIIQFLSAEFQASVQAFGADAIIKRHRVHKASGTLQ